MTDFKELFWQDKVSKQLTISYDGGSFGNSDVYLESMVIKESLCSESTLRFGCCEASEFKVRILNNVIPLTGKKMEVSETLSGAEDTPFIFGKYKVNSDKPTADRKYRDIVSYDSMHDIITAEVSAWYNTILPNKDSTVTLKQFRSSFLSHFGIEQEEVELPNDGMVVERTIEPDKLSGKTVITCICEINGCFGHIGRNGKFQYIFLKEMIEGVYPSDTLYPRDDLYPADPLNVEKISKSHYIHAEYEDFTTERINKLLIRKEENDVGTSWPEGDITEEDNCYIVQDNFLLYGKSSEELKTIAANMYAVISKVWYRPAHVEAKGNPCLEVGDGIKLSTRYEIIYTYILQRTLKGIQALRDTYDAEGEQYQSEDVNSDRESIIQLKGKTNKLTRSIEETRSEIEDIEKGLSSKITQNAESIAAEVSRASASEGELASQISLNAQQILLKVSKDSIISEINQTAEKITISAQKIDLRGLVNADELVSKFATIVALDATSANLQNLIAGKASIDDLSAATATLGSMIAQRATIEQLNGVSARLDTVESNYISASTVKADYMEVANWTSGGYIKASRIDANMIASKISEVDTIFIKGLNLNGYFTYDGSQVKWCTTTIGGKTILYLGQDPY